MPGRVVGYLKPVLLSDARKDNAEDDDGQIDDGDAEGQRTRMWLT